MEWTHKEVIEVISYLLPGFLAAWVFHGLTPHPKQKTFERVVQALIFLSIVQGIVAGSRLAYGHYHEQGVVDWGEWGELTNQCFPPLAAIAVGLVFATLANNDWFHWVLRKLRITKRTSYPSNWFSAFTKGRSNVTLHLRNGRRVYGWPYEFPDQSKTDHFVLTHAWWVPDEGDPIPLPLAKKLLIPAADVKMVEVMKEDQVLTQSINSPTDQQNGKPSTPTTSPEAEPTTRIDRATGVARQPAGPDHADGIAPTPAHKEAVNRNRRNGKGRRK